MSVLETPVGRGFKSLRAHTFTWSKSIQSLPELCLHRNDLCPAFLCQFSFSYEPIFIRRSSIDLEPLSLLFHDSIKLIFAPFCSIHKFMCEASNRVFSLSVTSINAFLLLIFESGTSRGAILEAFLSLTAWWNKSPRQTQAFPRPMMQQQIGWGAQCKRDWGLLHRTGSRARTVPARCAVVLIAGESIEIRTAGGGSYGNSTRRDRSEIDSDIRNELLTVAFVRNITQTISEMKMDKKARFFNCKIRCVIQFVVVICSSLSPQEKAHSSLRWFEQSMR
jgi:hypothetical protein